MRQIKSKIRISSKQVFAATALVSAAWISSVAAQQTPGLWQGGTPGTNDPYFACLNVSADGTLLTALNTQCRGNQGQNQNSIDIQFNGGQTPSGAKCNQYSYRNLEFGDIPIAADGSFQTNFSNAFINTTITGQFAGQTVTGTAQSINSWINCTVNWEAVPVATP